MKLYGRSIPLDGGGYVVTVICPNEGSYRRLEIELSRIEADAFAPEIALEDGFPATGGGMATHYVEPAPELTPAMRVLAESQDEEPPLNGPDSPGEAAPVESQGGTD